MPRRVRFTEEELREAIAASLSWAEALRRLGYRSAGGNWRTIQKYARRWGIRADHFDSHAASLRGLRRHWQKPMPMSEVLVENSSYPRASLKRRLFSEGVKVRRCEVCGQGESWRGGHMALILDHINGIPNDNRIENLRIVCPNCAATFATHCGRKNRLPIRTCAICQREFHAKRRKQRYCSRECGQRASPPPGPRPETRKVERPPYEQLLRELERSSYVAVGRRYGVSDNAVRKWVRFYGREGERKVNG